MPTYLVLGGTGKTGRRVTAQLTAAGHDVRVAARRATATPFTWDDPSGHDAALAGVEGVWLVPPALRLDHAPLIGAFAARAAAAGVHRLVLLSARGADQGGEDNPLLQAERALVAGAGAATWTVVRPTWFAQNFTESFFAPDIARDNAVVAPTGDGAEPFVDVEDIAAVAVAALTDDRHAGAAYDLSGPRALTFAEAAEVLSGPAGRPLHHVDVAPGAWRDGAVEAGLPPDYAEVLATLFGLIRDGHDAFLSDGVQRALGRAPISFEAWAAREAGALRATAHAARA